MIELLVLIIILGLVTYRVARFIVLDTLIDGTRDKVIDWLERRQSVALNADKSGLLWAKLVDLIGCPFCITIWISAGAVFATRIFVGSFAMPVWVWLATAAFALLPWNYIDSE